MKKILLLVCAAILLAAGQALALSFTEDFSGATINAADLTTSSGLNQWNDLVRWQINSTGGNPDAWAQQTESPDGGNETSLLFYGFDATGLGDGTPFSLNFDFINSESSFNGNVYLGGLSGTQKISRFAPWPDLNDTNFFNSTISNNTTTWTSISTLNGSVAGDHEVLYLAFQMGGSSGLRGIDNVNLQVRGASVPEPATMFLLGAGLFGIGIVFRKKFIK